MDKVQTLQRAAVRLEYLMADYSNRLGEKERKQLQRTHREIKMVKSRLEHEILIVRTSNN